MADKHYKLTLKMYDGTSHSLDFVVPEGKPGYTPVKGVDYFTEADIEDIAIRTAELVETDIKTDETLCFDEDGVLGVNTTNEAEADNTLPITSAGVHALMGNIATDAIRYNKQTLTDEQKAQARANIGAAKVETPRVKAEITYGFFADGTINNNNEFVEVRDDTFCRYTNIIPVIEGDRFSYIGKSIGDAYPQVIWFDTNENVVSTEYLGMVDEGCKLVTAPSNVAFVRFCCSSFGDIDTEDAIGEYDKIKFEVLHVAREDEKREIVIREKVGGYYIAKNVFYAVAGMSAKRSDPIPVTSDDIFYFTGGNGASEAIWYDATGTILSRVNGTGSQLTLTPPSNAVLVRFISYAYNSDPSYCVLTIAYKTENKTLEYLQNMNYLWGKKYVACGDSFTAGDFAEKNDETWDEATQEYKTYCWHIANRNRMTLVNEAISGTTMYNNGSANAFSVARYTAIPTDADYITLCFGLNDQTSGGTIGTLEDTTNETVIGAWNVVLEYLITNMPYAKIGIIIADAYTNTTMRDAIVSVAKYWGIPYLDLKGDTNIPMLIGGRFSDTSVSSKAVALRNAAFQISDTDSHPNAKGHAYRSTIIENFMRSL